MLSILGIYNIADGKQLAIFPGMVDSLLNLKAIFERIADTPKMELHIRCQKHYEL